jgi:hypothetical protein
MQDSLQKRNNGTKVQLRPEVKIEVKVEVEVSHMKNQLI